MFGFANFLLLALFAAAVFDLIFALARGGGLRGALHGLWNTPHLLFGQQLAEWRLQLGRILFAAGLAAYEISVVFCNSMARQNWAWVQGVMSPVLEWLAFLCFGAKILFGTRSRKLAKPNKGFPPEKTHGPVFDKGGCGWYASIIKILDAAHKGAKNDGTTLSGNF